jgi:hypothetical protein
MNMHVGSAKTSDSTLMRLGEVLNAHRGEVLSFEVLYRQSGVDAEEDSIERFENKLRPLLPSLREHLRQQYNGVLAVAEHVGLACVSDA